MPSHQPGPGGPGGPFGSGGGVVGLVTRDEVQQELQLVDEQRDKIQLIQEENRQKNWAAMGQVRTEMFALRRMYSADKVDANAVAEQQKKVDELRRLMLKSRLESRNQVEAVLTPEHYNRMIRILEKGVPVEAAALDAGEARNVLIAENASQARDFWAVREHISAGHRPEGAQANHDVSVPVSMTPTFLREADAAMQAICPGVRIVAFGHMGDGNLHYALLQPKGADPARFPGEALTQQVYAIATGLGGSISAEHGIGVTRTGDLVRFKDGESLALMRALKRALDPKGVMNPRALLP